MANLIKGTVLFLLFGVIACGQVKTQKDDQAPPKSAKTDGTEASPKDNSNPEENPVAQKPSSHAQDLPFINAQPQAQEANPQSMPQGNPSTLTAPVNKPTDIPDSNVKIKTPAKEEPQKPKLQVIALLRPGEDSKYLLRQGYRSAVFESQVCQTRGTFSDGSNCFIVFSDGHVERVNPDNRKLITQFIEDLKTASMKDK